MSKEQNNINSIIDNLKKLNDVNKVETTLPSSGLKISIKPLQAKHISKINSSFMVGSRDGTFQTSFVNLMKSIFKEVLVLPDDATFSDFNLIDYHFILLKIREMLNPELSIRTDEDNETVEVNVTDHIKLFKKNFKTEKSFGKKSFKLLIKVPNFERYCKYNQLIYLSQKSSNEKNPNYEKISNEFFSFNLLMYLSKLSMVVDSEEVVFHFEDESPKTQMKILDLIPKDEFKKIFLTIGELLEPVKDCLSTNVNDVEIPTDHTLLIENID